ncbi:Cell wall assembly regulator [Monascus purpureus]|uniref:Cell wall assembly regulator n=1 Tax=Monascus purpureus TaxID=5098 RepID=A0A507QXF6_MONPU|nr:Cell wall assembly regulator [Monascus purpureus]
MTSYDRHASHDSPYRTGRHVPLSQSRHEPLTSVATSAAESRPDLTNPYDDEQPSGATHSDGWSASPTGIGSPTRPYSPGMRSLSSQQRRSNDRASGADGEIQMQSFHDGAPPPPPVSHSWKKIDQWLENNYQELYDNLGEGCTQNDINELEHELDCSLPLEVRESLMTHDGQECGGLPTGVIFGCMLLDCEEIVKESMTWKVVNEEYLNAATVIHQPVKSSAASSSSAVASSQQGSGSSWRQDLLDRQDSQPPGAVQKTYAHPAWIPLARDWGGNNIAIDLAPGPTGKWGQVIIFGRDYDCKYVVARSWAAFLATLADDICSGKAIVDEETNDLRLKAFKDVNPPYLEILRWRTDQKYGRRQPRRKVPQALGLNTSANNRTPRDSPYGSPAPSEERGRSPHRFPNHGSNRSPKTQFGVSRPLARVAEEGSSPVNTSPDVQVSNKSMPNENANETQSGNLMEVSMPGTGSENKEDPAKVNEQKPAEQEKTEELRTREPNQATSTTLDSEVLGEMKNVTI